MFKLNQILICLFTLGLNLFAQNQLIIPPPLYGSEFNLEIQNGNTQFFKGIDSPTFGINGNILAPTLILNKWDWVTMHVKNNLTGNGNSTTLHWHGLHVPAKDDGGPHQIIEQGSTWNPKFQILNDAGTYWYHPHGDKKTDLQVSRGLAGMIIIKDTIESKINLPRNYGVDDIPIIVQSKAFDEFNRIAIATEEDSIICVNGTVQAYLDAPAQVIRLRILNGSSMRAYNFGFSNNKNFKIIATDDGLIDSAIVINRVLLSPGERVEILLDLQGLQGQSIKLISFSSEMSNGIYGAKTVQGMMGATIPDYNKNPLNGKDIEILKINIVAQTKNPVLQTPTTLVKNFVWSNYSEVRNIELRPETMMDPQKMIVGPFNINGEVFDMEKINIKTYINNIEKWKIINNTGIAHPFHIHDVHFFVLNINGSPTPNYKKGKKDVVLVMPNQYVEIITKFEDFADEMVPYMYHCHLLHHEDDGMMGSFVVLDTMGLGITNQTITSITIYPNPANNFININLTNIENNPEITIKNILGEILIVSNPLDSKNIKIDISELTTNIYFIEIKCNGRIFNHKFIKI